MLARLLFGRSLGRASQALIAGMEDVNGEHARRPWVAVATLVFAVIYAAALSIRGIGFLPATAAYLFFSGIVLGPPTRRRAITIAVFAIVAAVVLDLLFRTIFKLDLS
jgi:hypothetical protein